MQMFEVYGSIDILVNNAALHKNTRLIDTTFEDWDDVLRVNLTGHFLCAREAAREFLRRGVVPELSCAAGKINCMSSVHDTIPGRAMPTTRLPSSFGFPSSGGVLMLMKTLALELAAHKVRVNGISPGAIKTPSNRSAWSTPEKEAPGVDSLWAPGASQRHRPGHRMAGLG